MQWEKVKKAGMAPTPRTSFALVSHKKRAVMFGGVTDQHGKGDHMFSTLHDELYQFNFESCRWYPIAVKVPAKQLAKASQGIKPSDTSSSQPGTDAAGSPDDAQGRAHGSSPAQSEATQSMQPSGSSAAQARDVTPMTGSVESGPNIERAEGGGGAAELSDGLLQPDLADKLSMAGVDKESALYKAAARIQSSFRGYAVRKV